MIFNAFKVRSAPTPWAAVKRLCGYVLTRAHLGVGGFVDLDILDILDINALR
ncbi:MAG: hypothetical protein KIG46_02955 [Bacteroidales bacterium]|nr:hypothetical protein [Bacteroidales bacterium]